MKRSALGACIAALASMAASSACIGGQMGLSASFVTPDGVTHLVYARQTSTVANLGGDPTTDGAPADVRIVDPADSCSEIHVTDHTRLWYSSSADEAILHVPGTKWGDLTIDLRTSGAPAAVSAPTAMCTSQVVNDLDTHTYTAVGRVGSAAWTLSAPNHRPVSGTAPGLFGLVAG